MLNKFHFAGGTALKMSDCGLSLAEYCKPNVVVLSCEDSDQTSLYNKVLSILSLPFKKKYRESSLACGQVAYLRRFLFHLQVYY